MCSCVLTGRKVCCGCCWQRERLRSRAQGLVLALVFGQTVRGPLAALKNGWEEAETPQDIINFNNSFNHQLYVATKLAKTYLTSVPKKIKLINDQQAECFWFSAGNQVLILLPAINISVPSKVLESVYGPQNYLISTPDRQKKEQLCHVNLLTWAWYNFDTGQIKNFQVLANLDQRFYRVRTDKRPLTDAELTDMLSYGNSHLPCGHHRVLMVAKSDLE